MRSPLLLLVACTPSWHASAAPRIRLRGGSGALDVDSMVSAANDPEALKELQEIMRDPEAMEQARQMMVEFRDR